MYRSVSRFSPALTDALASAGWSEGRNVTELVAGWRQTVAAYAMSASAEKALLEFGGLSGTHPQMTGMAGDGYRDGTRQTFVIDPEKCSVDKTVFQAVAQAAGESGVYPLGQMCSGQVFLAMGDSGGVYVYGAINPCCLGKNIDEALNAITLGEAGIPV